MPHDLPHVGPRDRPPGLPRLAPDVAPDVPPAGLVWRSVAGILDLAVIAVAALWYGLLVGVDESDPRLSGVQSAVFALLALAYPAVCEGLWGRTPGKRATGLVVVMGGGAPVTWAAVLRRTALRPVDSLPWVIPYALGNLWCIATGPERHQRMGDVWAGTKVVRVADVPART